MRKRLKNTKYFFLILLLVTMYVPPLFEPQIVSAAAMGVQFEGDGSAEHPYIIETPDQLYELSVSQSVYLGNDFQLAADIDFTGWDWTLKPWTPIGSDATPYEGTFDGAGHVIKGLEINNPALDATGLFGRNDGTIRNVGLEDVKLNGGTYTGGLAGRNTGKLHNVYSTGSVNGTASVGGLAGANYTGGIVQHAYSTANVTGGSNIGGLVGLNSGGTVQYAYATGNVGGGDRIGGLVGFHSGASSLIQYAYATGNVTGTVWDFGGLIGFIGPGSYTFYVYATGDVPNDPKAGGLVGYSNSGTIFYGFWRTDGRSVNWIGQNYGTAGNIGGKTLDELKQLETFSGWAGFEDSWWMLDGMGMPMPSASSQLQSVTSSVYLSDKLDITLSGTLANLEADSQENTALHVMVMDSDDTLIQEAVWPKMILTGTAGDWQTAFTIDQLKPSSGNLPDGQYTLRIWGEGSVQNTAIKQSTMIVDTLAPTIQLNDAPVDSSTLSVTVTADVYDHGSGIALQKWAYGDHPAAFFGADGTAFTGSFQANMNGTYTVYAKDYAGNESVEQLNITTIHVPSKHHSSPAPTPTPAPLLEDEGDSSENTVPPTPIHFTDISGHWAETQIIKAAEDKLVSGYPDGTFKPNNPVTRAEFAVMLVNVLKPEGTGVALSFTDNDKIGAWAKPKLEQALKLDIIKGYLDGTFRPDQHITRSEMANMLAKALSLSIDSVGATRFTDDLEIPFWAKGAVHSLSTAGVVIGRGGNRFVPNAPLTRAEAAVLLLQMKEKQ